MKILIISAFFPPQNSIASLRPYSWAKQWSKEGHEVTVLTLPKSKSSVDLDLPMDDFKVLNVDVPLLAWIRNKRGAVPAQGHPSPIESTARPDPTPRSLKAKWVYKLRQWQKSAGFFYGCRMPDILDFWQSAAYAAVKDETWDLVVSSAGPYGVHGPAHRLKQNGRAAFWIADWRDLWTGNHIYPGVALFRPLERWLERRWCRHADFVTSVSEPLAQWLAERYACPAQAIYNGYDPQDLQNLDEKRIFPDDGKVRMVYTGTLHNQQQDSSLLFQVMGELQQEGRLRPDALQLIFCGNNTNVANKAQEQGVQAYVEHLGMVPRDKAMKMQRDADALLLIEYQSDEFKGLLSGKVFEYIAAGPPVLALGVTGDTSVGQLLLETGKGVLLGADKSLIRRHLLDLLERRLVKQAPTAQQQAVISRYTRQEQAQQMLALTSGKHNAASAAARST